MNFNQQDIENSFRELDQISRDTDPGNNFKCIHIKGLPDLRSKYLKTKWTEFNFITF